ncbi:hypothetical protein EDD85DRAFT_957393 [Armillaria nabsnona]|nr:hypothetical protein EDD85DRAFT_957393 [Armillaria nabsnona]
MAVQGKRKTPPEQEPTAPKPKSKAKSPSSAAIRSSQPILAFLRRADSPFAGIGAYSSGIILYNSRILPLTKAEDVLNSPGRLARLIEVYVHFLSYMETAEDGKHASLIKVYNSANGPLATPFSGPKYYDPFEPAYIADTLSKQGHLGHLIFGEDVWKAMCPAALAQEECGLDPLSRYFDFLQQKKVNLLESKYLDLKCYDNTLVVPLKEQHFTPHVYWYNSMYKQIWSILDIPSLEKYEGGDHNDRLLTIIKMTSDGWTVGPLDLCAVSLYVHVNGKDLLYAEFVKRGIKIHKKSKHCGHNSKTLTKIEEAWYGRHQSLQEAELADVAEEKAWQFADEERRRALVGGKWQRHLKGIRLSKDAAPVIPQRQLYPSINEGVSPKKQRISADASISLQTSTIAVGKEKQKISGKL